MVVITLRETYDLSTKKDKMTMIGIHLPSMAWLVRQYQGLFLNTRRFRFLEANVAVACASTMPADPLQIGTDATDIAPQDMFNPILYRAVSNDSFDTLNARLYNLGYFNQTTTGGSVDQAQAAIDGVDNFALYYSILARPEGWRTASPQQGFSMTHLKPLVWTQLYSEQAPWSDSDGSPIVPTYNSSNSASAPSTRKAVAIRGHAQPYPSLPTFIYNNGSGGSKSSMSATIGVDRTALVDSGTAVTFTNLPDVANVFVGQILIPPSKLNLLYYRMVVEWKIEFIGIRPISDIMSIGSQANEGVNGNALAYFTDYTYSSANAANSIASAETASLLSEDTSSVAVENGNVELVMQS